jgi:hypothetical protein
MAVRFQSRQLRRYAGRRRVQSHSFGRGEGFGAFLMPHVFAGKRRGGFFIFQAGQGFLRDYISHWHAY